MILFGSPPGLAGQADTLTSIGKVKERLRYHYGTSFRFGPLSRGGFDTDLDRRCDGGSALCHGGDPDRGFCPANVSCHTSEDFLLDALEEGVDRSPESGYVLGQAVYALTKFGWMDDARDVVNRCEAVDWWCRALTGYLLYRVGAVREAEAPFRQAMTEADSTFRCRIADATWLLGEWDQRRGNVEDLPAAQESARNQSCQDRLALSDTLFWLADPLLHDRGNDRWAEHVGRAMSAHFSSEIREAVRGAEPFQRYVDYDWAMTVRRGVWDSYEIPLGANGFRFWTSEEAARFHFVPDLGPGGLSTPSWNLSGTILDEGFSPEYGPFLPMPVQVARFRRGSDLVVAVSADMGGERLRRVPEATAHLVLSPGPTSVPILAEQELRRRNPIFLAQAPTQGYLLSLEVMTELGIGWERRMIRPIEHGPGQVSDLLLFDPRLMPEPDSLVAAASGMLPSDSFTGPTDVGIYWEVYGAGEDEDVEFEITLRRAPGGLVDRLRGLFPGAAREGRGSVAWNEPSAGSLHSRSISIDLTGLEPGEYVLALSVRWRGQPVIERRRTLRLGD